MEDFANCHLLNGTVLELQKTLQEMEKISVDASYTVPDSWLPSSLETTIAAPISISGYGTYQKNRLRTLHLRPAPAGTGWQFQRTDLPNAPPIPVALDKVTSSSRAIILTAGAPENCVRMTEHIIALRLGLGIDNLVIQLDSEDPPLFEFGSEPLVSAVHQVGITAAPGGPAAVRYVTPKSTVAILRPETGGCLVFIPAEKGDRRLVIDAAIDFKTAIGQQRLLLEVHDAPFTKGASARTNCSAREWRLMRTVGKFNSDFRNIGYNDRNILIADRKKYVNEPILPEKTGKSLEAIWHRVCLDLIAALSLIPGARPVGKVISFKAGHALDVNFLQQLQQQQWLVDC